MVLKGSENEDIFLLFVHFRQLGTQSKRYIEEGGRERDTRIHYGAIFVNFFFLLDIDLFSHI